MASRKKFFDSAVMRFCVGFGIVHVVLTVSLFVQAFGFSVARHVAARSFSVRESLVGDLASLLLTPASALLGAVPQLGAIGAASYLLVPLNSALWAAGAGLVFGLTRQRRDKFRAA